MDKPKKPRRPKPVLSEDEKKAEFDKKVANIQRRMNEAFNAPEFLKLVNEVLDKRK